MFDRSCALCPLVLMTATLGCDPDSSSSAPQSAAAPTITRNDGPAYIAKPSSGFLELPADDHRLITLPLARHRPGRSELWVDGQLLGTQPTPWGLERASLEMPLAGAMVHGPHAVALLTAQYPRFPRSAPLIVSILPAPRKALQFTPGPAIANQVSRILYPGVGTLHGASLAWITNTDTSTLQLNLKTFTQDPPVALQIPTALSWLASARALALRHDEATTPQLLAWNLDEPDKLWLWNTKGDPMPIPLPNASAGSNRVVERLGVDAQGFWVSIWRGRTRKDGGQRPGDHTLWRLDPATSTLTMVSPQSLGHADAWADLRIAGVTRPVQPEAISAQLTLSLDAWRARSGPTPGSSAPLMRWKDDSSPVTLQRCMTLSPLLDEIWVGLDLRAQIFAGTRRGDLVQTLKVNNPGPPRLALAPQPLDCSVLEGRYLAVVPRRPPSKLQILHFDGAQMYEQDSGFVCEDAAFSGFGESTRLWCLRDGALFPMTLQWQDPKAPRAPRTPAP